MQNQTDQNLTALSLIDEHAKNQPNHIAVIFQDEKITYEQLVRESIAIARVLMSYGIEPGQHICILSSNTPTYYKIYFATLRCGASLFPINTDLSIEETAYIAKHSNPSLILIESAYSSKMDSAFAEDDMQKKVVPISDLEQQVRISESNPIEVIFPSRKPQDKALVIHTSGTTAKPKGVIATDEMEILSAQALQSSWQISGTDISVCALPLSYTFGLFSASYVAFCAGATVLLLPKFNPIHVLEAIQKHKATYMVGVPTMYAMMFEHVKQTARRYDLSSVRMMAASGAPITVKAKEDFQSTFGITLRDYYALSECTPIFSFDLSSGVKPPPPGSVGTLVRGAEVVLLDDTGLPTEGTEVGSLCIRSQRLTPGYYNDPSRNQLAFHQGWFKTGDVVYRDAEGYYFIVGRDRDQVISGGHKIASTEVEECISRIPGVQRVAVVGVPHNLLGEVVKAVIVCLPNNKISDEEVIQHCQVHLAKYKVPHLIEFKDQLPISPAGKILKRELI